MDGQIKSERATNNERQGATLRLEERTVAAYFANLAIACRAKKTERCAITAGIR